jgi:hypothetical protein
MTSALRIKEKIEAYARQAFSALLAGTLGVTPDGGFGSLLGTAR